MFSFENVFLEKLPKSFWWAFEFFVAGLLKYFFDSRFFF